MNFFEHQQNAKQRTRLLLVFMGIAVLSIAVLLYFVIVASEIYMNRATGITLSTLPVSGQLSWWQPLLFLQTLSATLALVVIASAFRMLMLSRMGGEGVAEMLGGSLVSPQSDDELERRFLNIVEEMSIASGVPIPKVYVLQNEQAINAFAAGHRPDDAAIAVTKGTLENLDRDELQGVIAHEYSHILNGDMAINLKLMGVLFGILLIALAGRFLLRMTFYSSGARRRRGRGGSAEIPMALIGIALFVAGYVGHFFARIIQAAISRQREFLADASAVQFTRNPHGIAGALAKIGKLPLQSKLHHPRAAEASHFYFGDGLRRNLGGWFSTHPPLQERIQRIDSRAALLGDAEEQLHSVPTDLPVAGMAPIAAAAQQARLLRRDGGNESQAPASIQKEDHDAAELLLRSVPEPLMKKAKEPFLASALLFRLLLSSERSLSSKQIDHLKIHFHPRIDEAISEVAEVLELDPRRQFVLAEVATGSLRHMSAAQKQRALHVVDWLTRSDGKLNLMEVLLGHLMRRHLRSEAESRIGHRKLKLATLGEECALVLSVLAHAGAVSEEQERLAFEQGRAVLTQAVPGLNTRLKAIPWSGHTLSAFGSALDRLEQVTLHDARIIHEATHVVLQSDGKMNAPESLLFVALSGALGIPIPVSKLG